MITILSTTPDMIHTGIKDGNDGKQICIALAQDVVDTIRWVQEHRKKMEAEIELRNSTPALASAWDQYQVTLRIVMDDV